MKIISCEYFQLRNRKSGLEKQIKQLKKQPVSIHRTLKMTELANELQKVMIKIAGL